MGIQLSVINPRFSSGKYVVTRGVHELVAAGALNIGVLLGRHLSGDWGDLDREDKAHNERALKSGQERIFSSYQVTADLKIWIITEWDRSVTTLLLPEEY